MMKCQACNSPDGNVTGRELWMVVGYVEIGLRAALCDPCHVAAPDRIRKELQSPLISSLIKVAGARFGFSTRNGTAPAAAPPGGAPG
jgi:hypothetical protein